MKKKMIIVAMFVTFFGILNTKAQTVSGVLISDIKAEYIEVRPTAGRAFSRKVWIRMDYGQQISNENADAYVNDDLGKRMEFNSVIDFINKMKNYGYELFQVYASGDDDKSYVLKRK